MTRKHCEKNFRNKRKTKEKEKEAQARESGLSNATLAGF
jgi:hypothetical protein